MAGRCAAARAPYYGACVRRWTYDQSVTAVGNREIPENRRLRHRIAKKLPENHNQNHSHNVESDDPQYPRRVGLIARNRHQGDG